MGFSNPQYIYIRETITCTNWWPHFFPQNVFKKPHIFLYEAVIPSRENIWVKLFIFDQIVKYFNKSLNSWEIIRGKVLGSNKDIYFSNILSLFFHFLVVANVNILHYTFTFHFI